MTLTDGEKLNPLWIKLEKHFTERLAELRSRNDSPLSQLETEALRGRIAEVKAFIALGKDQPILD